MGLQPNERRVLDLLEQAYWMFAELEVLHENDTQDFGSSIRVAQNIVLARPAYRERAEERKNDLTALDDIYYGA